MPISSSQAAPLVVVVGSTGNQGGSVIQALAKSDKPYQTRQPGLETVNVSLAVENATVVENAFAGANIAFMQSGFSFFYQEVAEGKMMVDAAKAAGVELLVWSALEPVAEIPRENTHTSTISTVKAKLQCRVLLHQSLALKLLEAGHSAKPRWRILEVTRKKVVYQQINDEEFIEATKYPPRVALDLLEMLKYYEEFGYFGGKDTKPSRQHLYRAPRTWADFVRATDWSSIFIQERLEGYSSKTGGAGLAE
ncbi:hypothetical protein B0H19DRAFT_1340408 [Mycena capillaripes]|nr:hypothetical protein B0H19DRAFT_1340408 [Mycena capillaripes]